MFNSPSRFSGAATDFSSRQMAKLQTLYGCGSFFALTG
jgi:hypothetical protein